MLPSTLRSYVEAMGGQLEHLAKFPDRPSVRLKTLAPVLAQTEAHVRKAPPTAGRPRRRARKATDAATPALRQQQGC
jgi:hypothetical protein